MSIVVILILSFSSIPIFYCGENGNHINCYREFEVKNNRLRTDEQPDLNFTFLQADGTGGFAGSTAFRVDDGTLDIFIEAFPAAGCNWDPATVNKADIIITESHGHMTHYDADTTYLVANNTGAHVIGNSPVYNDMISRGLNASKVHRLNPTMGQNRSISVLGVTVTAFGAAHESTGGQVDTYLVEMPNGVRWFHNTCGTHSSCNSFMQNDPKFYGLDAMLLNLVADFNAAHGTYGPHLMYKHHIFGATNAEIWTDYPGGHSNVNHNHTHQYIRPIIMPELTDGNLEPMSGDTETLFNYTLEYSYREDVSPTRHEVVIDGIAFDMETESTSGWKSGVTYSFSTNLTAGMHEYYFIFAVGGKLIRMPTSGNWSGPQVNSIPILSTPTHWPEEGNSETDFNFNITYTDLENDPAINGKVFIDGTGYLMSSSDSTYDDGSVYTYKTLLPPGNHTYFFSFSDGMSEVRCPAVGYIYGPNVILANHAPSLDNPNLNPYEGNRDTIFTYSIEYSDGENDIPEIAQVFIDGVGFELNTSEDDFDKGVTYTYSTSLGLGNHTYYFLFSDGEFSIRAPLLDEEVYLSPSVLNREPAAIIDTPADLGQFTTDDEIVFNSSSSYDSDNDNLTFHWHSSIDGDLGTGMILYGNLSMGEHTITLTVSDGFYGISKEVINIKVIELLPVLYASIETNPIKPIETGVFTVQVTVRNVGEKVAEDIEITIAYGEEKYSRDIILLDIGGNTLLKFTFNSTNPGKNTIQISLKEFGNFTHDFTVLERIGPTAKAGTNLRIEVGDIIHLDGSGSTSLGIITLFHWDFGDGNNATGKIVNYSYSKHGTFKVTLTVTDELGREDVDSITILVKEVEKDSDDSKGVMPVVVIVMIIIVLIITGVVTLVIVIKFKSKNGTEEKEQRTDESNASTIGADLQEERAKENNIEDDWIKKDGW